MADDETPPPSRAGGGHGLGKKIGPLPLGAWAVIVGGLVGVVWFLRNRGGKADSSAADSSAAGGDADAASMSLVPINQGLGQDQFEQLLDAIKDLHGDPSEDDDDKPPTTTLPGHPPPMHFPKPPKGGPHKPPPRKPPRTVTTVKWTRQHTPWNSTLWGIANHEHVKGGWQYLQKINHLHGDPKKALKPGMKIKLGP